MRNYVNLAVPTMPLLVADKRGAAETKIIAYFERSGEVFPSLIYGGSCSPRTSFTTSLSPSRVFKRQWQLCAKPPYSDGKPTSRNDFESPT
jgi:hypothetical protein